MLYSDFLFANWSLFNHATCPCTDTLRSLINVQSLITVQYMYDKFSKINKRTGRKWSEISVHVSLENHFSKNITTFHFFHYLRLWQNFSSFDFWLFFKGRKNPWMKKSGCKMSNLAMNALENLNPTWSGTYFSI